VRKARDNCCGLPSAALGVNSSCVAPREQGRPPRSQRLRPERRRRCGANSILGAPSQREFERGTRKAGPRSLGPRMCTAERTGRDEKKRRGLLVQEEPHAARHDPQRTVRTSGARETRQETGREKGKENAGLRGAVVRLVVGRPGKRGEKWARIARCSAASAGVLYGTRGSYLQCMLPSPFERGVREDERARVTLLATGPARRGRGEIVMYGILALRETEGKGNTASKLGQGTESTADTSRIRTKDEHRHVGRFVGRGDGGGTRCPFRWQAQRA